MFSKNGRKVQFRRRMFIIVLMKVHACEYTTKRSQNWYLCNFFYSVGGL